MSNPLRTLISAFGCFIMFIGGLVALAYLLKLARG